MKQIIITFIISILALYPADNNGVEFNKEEISEEVTNNNSEFATDIFRELNKEDSNKNIFISPFSISTALTMTYNGAVGETKKEMEEALRYLNININEVNQTYKNLIPYLNQVDNEIDLDINNSIWYKQGEKIKENFIDTNKKIFNAKVEQLNFSNPKSANIINSWIKESTKGKIEKMLEPPIPSDIVMYLINAVYFKGSWTVEFDEEDTFDSIFTDINGEKQNIRMMKRKGEIYYSIGKDYKTIKLPYGKEKISMYFILPEKNKEINNFIKELNGEKIEEMKKGLRKTENVNIQIPRFKMEYGIKNLNESLSNMGMPKAFTKQADFSDIGDNLSISEVLHKAVVEVNEEGSEAAGVTVVGIKTTSISEPKSFIANRPFVFFIAEEDTGTILFLGKYGLVE